MLSNQTPPIQVTFDRNVYEGIVNNCKTGLSEEQQEEAILLQHLIKGKSIEPFISESVFTLESLPKKAAIRRSVLQSNRLVSESLDGAITLYGDPTVYPKTPVLDSFYLKRVISMGFKILPIFRLGRLVNPDIKAEWRYFKHYDQYMGLPEKFAEVVAYIETLGGGVNFLKELLSIPDSGGQPWTYYAKGFSSSEKKFNAAVAEWSDADSVATHVANGIEYFCTNDRARGAGAKSVFSVAIRAALKEKFGLKIVSPEELISIINERP